MSDDSLTFDDACEAVLDAPDAEHSLYTTLAPLYDRMMDDADDRYDAQYRRLASAVPESADSVLNVGCGVGGLLPLLEARFRDVVGLDSRPELLTYARREAERAELVVADVTDYDLDRRFDVVCAFDALLGNLTTDAEVREFFETAARHLEPGGTLLFDATAGTAALAEPVSVYASAGYRLERAVDVVPARGVPGAELRADYRVTHLETGQQETTTEWRAVRTFDADELREFLAEAGFEDVVVDSDAGKVGSDDAVDSDAGKAGVLAFSARRRES